MCMRVPKVPYGSYSPDDCGIHIYSSTFLSYMNSDTITVNRSKNRNHVLHC